MFVILLLRNHLINILFLQTREGWSIVFTIGGLVHLFGITFYGIFASGELQPWAEPQVQERPVWSPTKPPMTETSFVSCCFLTCTMKT